MGSLNVVEGVNRTVVIVVVIMIVDREGGGGRGETVEFLSGEGKRVWWFGRFDAWAANNTTEGFFIRGTSGGDFD